LPPDIIYIQYTSDIFHEINKSISSNKYPALRGFLQPDNEEVVSDTA
jgi:hypothetical protein